MTGLVILLLALAAATAFGLYRAATDGRFTGTRTVRGAAGGTAGAASAAEESATAAPAESAEHQTAHQVGAETDVDDGTPGLSEAEIGGPLGERATLLQFSSAFCAPCRVARRVLGEVAETEPGVRHVEVDAESHLELVRRLGVMRTPTTLVLDQAGREVARASGAPTKAQVSASLAALSQD